MIKQSHRKFARSSRRSVLKLLLSSTLSSLLLLFLSSQTLSVVQAAAQEQKHHHHPACAFLQQDPVGQHYYSCKSTTTGHSRQNARRLAPRQQQQRRHLSQNTHGLLMTNKQQNDEARTKGTADRCDVPVKTTTTTVGLYRSFGEWACDELLETGWVTEDEFARQCVVAPLAGGGQRSSVVRLSTRVFRPACVSVLPSTVVSPIRYARYALLETIPDNNTNSDSPVHTSGIQVLNFVIFPSLHQQQTISSAYSLPVWGADLVSLPPNKHLLLLDAQPMTTPVTPTSNSNTATTASTDKDNNNTNTHTSSCYHWHWKEWYERHVVGAAADDAADTASRRLNFPWGGDLPPKVQRFVSPYALWTRMIGESGETERKEKGEQERLSEQQQQLQPPLERLQGPFRQAYQEHLKLYLELLLTSSSDTNTADGAVPTTPTPTIPATITAQQQQQQDYIDYRRANDPARPMLKSLYGQNFTEELLENILFPNV